MNIPGGGTVHLYYCQVITHENVSFTCLCLPHMLRVWFIGKNSIIVMWSSHVENGHVPWNQADLSIVA